MLRRSQEIVKPKTVICPLVRSDVAVVLRGAAFRGANSFSSIGPSRLESCSPYADSSEQLNATSSLIDNVVLPLERPPCRNKVHVIVSECSHREGCPLMKRVLDLLGRRVVGSRTRCSVANQPQSVRSALELLKTTAAARGGLRVTASYDLVILTRHDVVWTKPIIAWHANFSQLLFLGGCEPLCTDACTDSSVGSHYGGPPSRCVQDVLHVLPGRLFDAFDRVVGTAGTRCFDGANKGSGHGCFRALEARAGPTGFVLPLSEWRPRKSVRERNPVCHYIVPRWWSQQLQSRHDLDGVVNATSSAISRVKHNDMPCFISPHDRLRLPFAVAQRLCG